jgi:hypothetical protein
VNPRFTLAAPKKCGKVLVNIDVQLEVCCAKMNIDILGQNCWSKLIVVLGPESTAKPTSPAGPEGSR